MNEQMEKIINEALNGNKETYTNLILSIKSDLYRVAQARLDNIDDINDAIQETITNSFKNLKSLKNPAYFKTWITRILINECNLIYRKRSNQLGLFNKLTLHINKDDAEISINSVESSVDFQILINCLNYDEKIVITLFYNNRYSIHEISEILDISENTVKSRLTRAKNKLKNMYDKGGIKNESKK